MVDVISVVAFIVAFIAVSAATADVTGIERRLRRLDRGDPATAEAVRRAQAVTDLARGGFFGLESIAIVCTPSRRTLHMSGDYDSEPEPMPRWHQPARAEVASATPAESTAAAIPAEALSVEPASVEPASVAPAPVSPPAAMPSEATPVDTMVTHGRHVVSRNTRPRRRLARGIRLLFATRAPRTGRATTRQRAGSR